MTFSKMTAVLTVVGGMTFAGWALAQQQPESKTSPKAKVDSAESTGKAKMLDDKTNPRTLEQLKKDPSWREPRDGQVPRVVTPDLREAFKPVGKPLYFEGILDRMEDGALILASPMTEPMRKSWAQTRKMPVSRAPKALERVFRISGKGPSASMVRRRTGSMVRLEVVQDRQGFLWVTDVLTARK
jgi:hypothetical protein